MKLWGLVELKPGVRSLFAEWMGDDGYPVPSRKRVRRYLAPSDDVRSAANQIIREMSEKPR